jgi:hypothetical protein
MYMFRGYSLIEKICTREKKAGIIPAAKEIPAHYAYDF